MGAAPIPRGDATFSLRSVFGVMTLVAVLIVIARQSPSFVSQAEASQIHTGMHRKDVEAILGPPHLRPKSRDERWCYYCDFPNYVSPLLTIGFDSHGQVAWMSR